MKKTLVFLTALTVLAGCNLPVLPQGDCSEGYVTHTSPAGEVRCIKPGMAIGSGVIETGLIIAAGAL